MERDVIVSKVARLAALRTSMRDLKAAEHAGYAVDNRRLTSLYQEQVEILLQLSNEAGDSGKDELRGLMCTTVAGDLRDDGVWKRLLLQLAEWATQ
jgi:hypothetical protein